MARLTSNKKDRDGKKTVVIAGMAQTSRHACPWNDNDVDIWVLNESIAHNYIKKVDLLSQLHPSWDYFRDFNFNDPMHAEFLRNEEWTEDDIGRLEALRIYKELPRGFPEVKVGNKRRPEDIEIVLLEENEEVVGTKSIYPFSDILESYGNNSKRVRYFTSTAPYLIALAIERGYERIEMYGFEMSSQEEYAYQKPCLEFWLGIAIGKGIEVYVPEGCRLLGGEEKLYGYDKMPGFTKMHAEIRKNELGRMRANSEKALMKVRGEMKNALKNLQVAQNKGDNAWVQKLNAQLGTLNQQEKVAIANLNVHHGAFQEMDKTHKDLSAIPSDGKIRPVLPK